MFSTSASILCDQVDNEIWLKSITPGEGRFQHSHRSKLAGVAASLVGIEYLCSYYNLASSKATIGLDGLKAINNILVDIPAVQQADYDLIIFIQTKIKLLPISVKFLWIKGHQDDLIPFHQLDFPVQLNVRADQMAKSFLYQHIQTQVPDPLTSFSTKQWNIIKDGKKMCNLDQNRLYMDITRDKLISYWGRQCNMDTNVISDVDWEGFGAAFQSCTFACQRCVMKINSGHAPVGKMMLMWKKQDHARCPLCNEAPGDIHHMLTCCSPHACDSWETALSFFQDQLADLHTHPDLSDALVVGLHNWHRSPARQPAEPSPYYSWRVQRSFRY